jgi:transcription-repair coupling factor (superfamily II helicase)
VGYDLYVQMVSEAVAELKGEELRPPAEIKLDLPVDANLPKDYVAREDLRLEAYRRLAVVTTFEEVEDIRSEWVDRYGPVPPEAEALLDVARLRAEAARIGIREVTVSRDVARISPIKLKTSQSIRLARRFPKAIYKEDLGQIVLPLAPRTAPAEYLLAFLGEMVPNEAGSVASTAS